MVKMQPKNNCPINNFSPCKELECAWFVQIRGNNPNTGESVDEWACAIAWLPVLLIENSQQQRHTGAAVESFRNEMVAANQNAFLTLVNTPPHNALVISKKE